MVEPSRSYCIIISDDDKLSTKHYHQCMRPNKKTVSQIGFLTDWDLTALSAQKRLYSAFKKYDAVERLKLVRKFNMLRVGNAQNETITIDNYSVWSL